MPDHHRQKQSNASVRHAIILGIFPALGWILAMAQPNWLPQQSISPTPTQPAQSPFPTPDSSSRSGVPQWSIDPNFESEVFTFVRIQYDSYGGWGAWRVDYPAADLNFSYRLEELTSMRVHPDGKILRLDDLELNQYPFIFMIDARNLFLSDLDAQVLRNYLLAGGFLMLDDLWGNRMLDHLISEFKKVFPDKNFVELPLDHEIFQGVFRLTEKPQVPSEDAAHEGAPFGITWETNIGEPDANLNTPHYKAILDDAGRIMILMCHNTDISDGWEEEGISEWFFTHFSEKYSYPMGINIIFYCLTH